MTRLSSDGWGRRQPLICALAALLTCEIPAQALTIVSGPVLVQAPNAPLAGTLQLTTDTPSRVSVSVTNGSEGWERSFYDYGTMHALPLLGFKPGRTNTITVSVFDKNLNEATAPQPVVFVTAPLPSDFPTNVVYKSVPDKMEPGYTLFRTQNRNNNKAYIGIVDSSGDVVWYSGVTTTSDVRQLANGDLFVPLTTSFVEINMLGNTVHTWPVPNGLTINLHDGVPTDHGTILYLNDASEVVSNFPSSATNPNAPLQTTSVLYNRVVEISATNASLLNLWSPVNFLDPRRLTYLTFDSHTTMGWDIEHANAVIEDPRDQSIIVSMRNQNIVFKFMRDTGQLKWILGPHENWSAAFQPYLLTPVGQPFAWQYGQHAPTLTPQGTLLLYDDGNSRATPFDPPLPDASNYSRAVEYSIDEDNMQVSQVWDYGRTNEDVRLYTDRVGNAEWQPKTGNVLINFGYVIYVNGLRPSPTAPAATMFRLREVTHDPVPEVVFDLAFFDYGNTSASYKGYFAYRCHRIPDLYSIQPGAASGLTLSYDDGIAILEFTADPAGTYAVEASIDMTNWEDIGAAGGDDNGFFHFVDALSGDFPARYYRVLSLSGGSGSGQKPAGGQFMSHAVSARRAQ